MRALLTFSLIALLCGCSSNAQRIDERARSAGMQRYEIVAQGYRPLIYTKDRVPSGRLIVFLEGDGQPWRGGVVPHTDPTTSNPLALELMTRTPRAAAYVSRPCYHALEVERCDAQMWTDARYSESVINTMAAAIRQAQGKAQASELVIVGHSGGGTLAVLIAERLDSVRAVITIAANLDVRAWTAYHGYLPLTQSLNPADSTLHHPWREIHLAGRNDPVVPLHLSTRYFERYPDAIQWILDEQSHACCWAKAWPALWERIEEELGKGDG